MGALVKDMGELVRGGERRGEGERGREGGEGEEREGRRREQIGGREEGEKTKHSKNKPPLRSLCTNLWWQGMAA